MKLKLAAAILLLAAAPEAQGDHSPHRQFDFWLGEWSVQNRHLQPDGTWREGDVTRARITPVCGGRAVLEEWAGTFRGSHMNGFSLRAFDESRGDWDLLLSWTSDSSGGNVTFGNLRGTFSHGRGEFFSGSQANMQRYSFSDALVNSVRWDSATSSDGLQTWKTDWIMEFSRTRPGSETTQDELFNRAWNAGTLASSPAARSLDWLVGEWSGTTTDVATGEEQEVRKRVRLLNKDCLVLDLVETRAGADDWNERLSVRGWVGQRGAWESWSLSETDTVLRRGIGAAETGRVSTDTPLPSGVVRRETLLRFDATTLVVEEEERAAGATDFVLMRVAELERTD